jgi:hypothetical protein
LVGFYDPNQENADKISKIWIQYKSYKSVLITHFQTPLKKRKKLLLANEYNVKGQVGHVERFNPAFIATKNMIENPMFIETHRLAEFNPRGTDVPVVLDLMIHDIDVILSVVQSKVKILVPVVYL